MATSLAASAAALPKATCRATDKTEAGPTGQMTAAELAAGPATYNCNVDLVGAYQGEGASWQLTAWKNCAYFDQRNNTTAGSTTETHPGVVVLDVSDPTHPTPTTWLSEAPMIDPWESLKVNTARQLLGGDQRAGSGFATYDIAGDCKAPVLKANAVLAGSIGHTGQWAPDGKSYYVTPLRATPSIIAIDTTDAANPVIFPNGIKTFSIPTELPFSTIHDLEFSKDGKTAYITMFASGANAAKNGIALIDVSDFQAHLANPQYRIISSLTWDDGSTGAQNALPVTIAGKPYIISADESGLGAAACTQNKSPSGFPRIIDISDPVHPTTISKIQLGVHDPATCTSTVAQPVTSAFNAGTGVQTIGQGGFGFSCHYCNVDDVDNAKILGCSCFAAGFRIFDIHDPVNPKEIAYFKPPGTGTKVLPSSQYANQNTVPPGAAPWVRNYDWATAKVSFPKDRGDTTGDIWITSQDNGFQVIKLFSAVSVSPKTLTTGHGQKESFKATVTGAAANAGAVWTITEGAAGGSIDADGTYHAPSKGGTYHLVATALIDGTKSDTATVTVLEGGGCSAGGASLSALGALAFLILMFRRRPARG